jgi:methyltransferase-like protein
MIEMIFWALLAFIVFVITMLIIEYLTDVPTFVHRLLLLRDFKIALFTELDNDKDVNVQKHVIVGVTWFNIIISYQTQDRFHEKEYGAVFSLTKKGWVVNGCLGYNYNNAKIVLDNIKKEYFKKRYQKKWIGGLLKEDEL